MVGYVRSFGGFLAIFLPIVLALWGVAALLGLLLGFDGGGEGVRVIADILAVVLSVPVWSRVVARLDRRRAEAGRLRDHAVPGSAVVGHRYWYGGHRYLAAHSSEQAVSFVPQPTPQDRADYPMLALGHDQIAEKFRNGALHDLDDDRA